jgi:hypothetical protein
MTNILQLLRRSRRIVPAVVIVVGLLIISAIMFQQVTAQDGSDLKPPFKLHQPAQLAAPLSGVPPLPLNAPIIMSQTFDSSFVLTTNYNFNVNDTSAPWHLVNANGVIDANYTWGPISGVPVTGTLWNVGTQQGGTPIAAGQPYTKNMQAYAIYGPIDLSDYTSAFISMTYVMDTLKGDLFGVAFSTDGTNFTMPTAIDGRDPSLSVKHTAYYIFPKEFVRRKPVWIALVFTSENRDTIDALGVYVYDIVLRAQPAFKLWLPLIRRDPTPTPTLTPTPSIVYVYDYTFGSGQNTDTQFATWGSKVTDAGCSTSDAGGCKWGQDIVTSGHPGGAMYFYQNGLNALAGASPNNQAPTDFELSADFYTIQGKSDARIGLVFGASDSAFGRSGGTPFFDPNRNMYKFDLQFNENDNTVMSYYRLQAFVTSQNGYATIVDKSVLPAGLVGNTGTWNNIKIQRLGANIKIYVNGFLLINVNDSTYIGSKKYGLFLQSKSFNSAGNPLRIYFDNVRVRALP